MVRGEFRSDAQGPHDPRADPHVADAAAAFGIDIDAQDAPSQSAADDAELFYLWPEHVRAYVLWAGVQTQWRVGFGGPTGLDYAGVRASPAFRALPRRRAERTFVEVQIMERAALAEWAAQRAGRADVLAR